MKILLTTALTLFTTLPAVAQEGSDSREPLLIGDQPYKKLADRKQTLRRMIDLLAPEKGNWGEWHLLSPFPYKGHGQDDLLSVLEPEGELARMTLNGPGPDLTRTYQGKNGTVARWVPLPNVPNRKVDLKTHDDPTLNDYAVCYLHTTIQSDREQTVEIPMGSDDGARVWLNGRHNYTIDVPRGLVPDDDLLRLELKTGTNHILFKIDQGEGGWDFQITTRELLPARLDAHLYYQLDRDFPPSRERRHYRIVTYPVPEDVVLEVGGLAFYGENHDPVVSTRRGDVWLVRNAYEEPPLNAGFQRFARGLHEPLGAAVRVDPDQPGRESIYVVQRGELTRLVDEDGDDVADLYAAFSTGWGVSGNYHEFAFGPKFDADGNAWVTLNVGFCGSLGKAMVPYRGSALKIAPDGQVTWVCDGLRSPNGFAMNEKGDWFYVDNQGDYIATNRLSQLKPGSWHGHPASLRWREDLDPDDRPPLQPASVWFPYRKMGQSAADVVLDDTGGRFGPFQGQFFVGDQLAATVMRVSLEEVDGHYQGACYPFLEGFACGVNRMAFAPDGSMIVGETDRGWGSVGRMRQGLERVVYTGEEAFEILAMRATSDGFVLEFTRDLDPASGGAPASYRMKSYTYTYHADYGAPEEDTRELKVMSATLDPGNPRVVRLVVDPLRAGYVHELSAAVKSTDGEPLLHEEAYYTLINIPGQRATAKAGKLPRLLVVTPSASEGHDVVRRPRPHIFSVVEERMIEESKGKFDVTVRRGLESLDPTNLAKYDAALVYANGDVQTLMAAYESIAEWMRAGGALSVVHSSGAGQPGAEKELTLRALAPDHPAMLGLDGDFTLRDTAHGSGIPFDAPAWPLLGLVDGESGEVRPVSWLREHGEGRVFQTVLGHSRQSWRDPRFIRHLLGGLRFALEGIDLPMEAPPGARILFDGSDLSAWHKRGGGEPGWKIEDGQMEVVAGSGDLVTRESFGDFHLHVEFRTPGYPPEVKGQARGNSGVYVLGRYEVQVLDSYGLELQMGDCGSIYGKKIADQNASRPPLRWQTYDIRFRAPRFDDSGSKNVNTRMSVWHNGILIHDDVEIDSHTGGALSAQESATGPILLQDHGNPVRYRNIWLLPVED